MSVFGRLTKIARANFYTYSKKVRTFINLPKSEKDSFDDYEYNKDYSNSFKSKNDAEQNCNTNQHSDIPSQVIEDLATFGLKPPSSINEVKKNRNWEIKKYHSDKFINDPEKLKTSKEIMQIYNAAYDRLKKYYKQV